MKRIVVALAWFGGIAAGASCGGGTLGTPGAGGANGMVQGVGNAPGPLGIAGGGPGASSGSGAVSGDPGVGGDGAPIAGAGGFGGTDGSISGRGGTTGRGGSGFSCPPQPPVCGPACGNGMVDTCGVPCPGFGVQAEQCDGDQFGGDTCAKRGYGSGKLACTNTCMVDEVGCSDCMPAGGAVGSCGPAPITFPDLGGFAIAATDTEVGVAQVDYNQNTGANRLTFARLDAKLALITAAALEDTGQAGPLQGAALDAIAVATTASGWVVGGCTGSGQLFVIRVDANGKKAARTIVADFNDLTFGCSSGAVSLVQRPGGGALMLWMTSYGGAAATSISADGLSVGKPWLLLDPLMDTFAIPWASGAWVGDAYLVAQPTQVNTLTGYNQVLRLFRISPDGQTTVVSDMLKNEISGSPILVAGATDLRLVYPGVPPGGRPGYDIALLWRRIGSMGELRTSAVPFDMIPTYGGRAPLLMIGDDTLVLMSNGEQEELMLARVDLNGKAVGMAYDVARSPSYGLYAYDMVRRGSEVVVAWAQPGRTLMLARVTP